METYRWTLEWVLERQGLTLLVTAATLAVTVLLYIAVPKGFLPLQDTSLVTAVVEGGPEISFAEMKRMKKAVEDAFEMGTWPRVSLVVSSPIIATLQFCHAKIALRSRDHSTARCPPCCTAERAVAKSPWIVYFQPCRTCRFPPALAAAVIIIHP